MEDDDEDSLNTSMGSGIYACTPSLMALQQMKNRLHMAYLGKRLMKWTVLATSRDLRRIALDIMVAQKALVEDVREALVRVARCRYFYSQLNAMTIENNPAVARLTVSQAVKSVAGCKFKSFEVLDCGEKIYVHLGIDKGGQLIAETKSTWLRLTKKLIETLSLRISFQYLDAYTKIATKKMNVLSKIVIPKTLNTIKYILLELEERSREDFFRLKKVVDIKAKRRAKTEVKQKCPICFAVYTGVSLGEKCDCLKIDKGPCKVEETPICIEKISPKEIVKTADFELGVSKTKEKEDRLCKPKSVVEEYKCEKKKMDSLKPPVEQEASLRRGSCEGFCIRKKEHERPKPIHEHDMQPDDDEKNVKSESKSENKCDTPCCKNFSKQPSIASSKKVKIDLKTDSNRSQATGNINFPPCTCLGSKKVEPSSPCSNPKSSSNESAKISNVGSSMIGVRTPADTSIKKYTKIRRFQDCDGTLREEKITITVQTDSYEVPADDDDVRVDESEIDDEDYIIGYCLSTDQSTPQMLNPTRSEPIKRKCCHHKARSSRSLSDTSHQNNFSSSDSSAVDLTYTVTRIHEYDMSGDSSSMNN